MIPELKMPICVCELETGNFYFFNSLSNFQLFIEEFFDILEEEFKFWDATGNSIRVTSAFLERVNDGIFINSSEEISLREKLLQYANKIGFSIVCIDNMTIENIIKLIR